MTLHQLGVDPGDHRGEIGPAVLLDQVGDEDHLKEEIAQLLGDLVEISGVDRRRHLVRFFEEIGAEIAEPLLTVPRTAVGAAQPPQQVFEEAQTIVHR